MLEYDADKKRKPVLSQGGAAAAIIEETISDDENAQGAMNAGDLMKPDLPKQKLPFIQNKRETMTKSIVSKAIEIPVAPLSPSKFDI